MNKVRQFRQELKLTQKDLAELAGTSQQQIQRIETGKSPIDVETAARMSAALGKDLQTVFPAIKAAAATHIRERAKAAAQKPRKRTGLVRFGNFQFRFKNGTEYEAWVKMDDADRLASILYDPQKKAFALFDTRWTAVAINLRKLTYVKGPIIVDEMEPIDFSKFNADTGELDTPDLNLRGEDEEGATIWTEHGDPTQLVVPVYGIRDLESDDFHFQDVLTSLDTLEGSESEFILIKDLEEDNHWFNTDHLVMLSISHENLPAD